MPNNTATKKVDDNRKDPENSSDNEQDRKTRKTLFFSLSLEPMPLTPTANSQMVITMANGTPNDNAISSNKLCG